MGEYSACDVREKHSDDEAEGRDDRCQLGCPPEHFLYAGVFPCPVVVSGYRLHSLVESDAYHYEHEREPVADSVCSDSEVSAVFPELLVYEKCHYAGCGIHQERTQAYGKRVSGYPGVQPKDAFLKVQHFCPVAEVPHYDCQGAALRDYRRPCRSGYSHVEHEDEYRVKYGVENDSEESESHGLLRIA